jgi:hypothetical protein
MDHDPLVMFHGIAGVLGRAIDPRHLDPVDPPCPIAVVGVIPGIDGGFPGAGIGEGGGRFGGGDERGSRGGSILTAGSEQDGEEGDGEESGVVGHASIMRVPGQHVKEIFAAHATAPRGERQRIRGDR